MIEPRANIDFSHYLTDYNEKSTSQKICDPAFQRLREKYQQHLQAITADTQIWVDLKNRAITALFLDTVSKMQHLPEELEVVKKHAYSSSTINSIHLISYLKKISLDPSLELTTQKVIHDWIQTEKEYLELAIIMDGWRIQDPAMREVLAGKANIRDVKFSLADDEEQTVAHAIAGRLRELKVGHLYKFLSGSGAHETRIVLEKVDDRSLHLYEYDVGNGIKKTVKHLRGIDTQTLCDPEFWVDVIKKKMSSGVKLREFGGTRDDDLVDRRMQKSQQLEESCAGLVPLAQLKHEIVRHAATIERGETQYKRVRCLLRQLALKKERHTIHPVLYYLLERTHDVKQKRPDFVI